MSMRGIQFYFVFSLNKKTILLLIDDINKIKNIQLEIDQK